MQNDNNNSNLAPNALQQTQTTTEQPLKDSGMQFDGQQTIGTVIQIALFAFAFYFFLIRPQQKKEKLKQERSTTLKKGDMILINSGLIAKFHKFVGNDEMIVEVADGVRIRFLKNSFLDVITQKLSENDDNDDDSSSKKVVGNKKGEKGGKEEKEKGAE